MPITVTLLIFLVTHCLVARIDFQSHIDFFAEHTENLADISKTPRSKQPATDRS